MAIRSVLTSCALFLFVLAGMASQEHLSAQGSGSGGSGYGVGVALPAGSWQLRVNTSATNAHRIVWHVETLDGTAAAGDWWFHSGGGSPTLGLPKGAVGDATDVTMRLTAEPSDSRGSVCIFFKNNPVRRVEFSGQQRLQLNSEQRDPACSRTSQ
jgi:hypothetical protein